MTNYLIGIDAGSRSVRCLLVDVETARVFSAARKWSPDPTPGANFAYDLDTDKCWRLVAETAREAMAKAQAAPNQIAGIAATSMRHTIVVLDDAGRTLFAAPNRDGRAVSEGIELADEQGALFNARTGHYPMPIFTAARLRWMANAMPDAYEHAAHALALSDWLAFKLTGEIATDPSQAGETLLYDLKTRAWADDLIDQLNLPRRLLPPIRHSGTRLGTLTENAADALGLKSGIPVAVGGADTQCGLLGAGAVQAGEMVAVAGSTTPVQLVTDQPIVDADARLWTSHHIVPGLWIVESNAGAMGEALEWIAGVLYPDSPNPVARFVAEAKRAAPGAGGILSDFGAGVMNAKQMNLPVGTLALTHLGAGDNARRRANLNRAILEGTAFAIRANAEQISACVIATLSETKGKQSSSDLGIALSRSFDSASLRSGSLLATLAPHASAGVTQPRIAGGMTRSDLWAQIVCDTFNAPMLVAATPEATALGAAICAGVGAGTFRNLADGAKSLVRTRQLSPDPEHARVYGELYTDWNRLRETHAAADDLAAGVMVQALMSAPQSETRAVEPAPRLRILATADLDESALTKLRAFGEVTYANYRKELRLLTGDELVDALKGYHVFITEVDVLDMDALARLPDLRVVAACRGAAVNVDVAACTALGIPVLYAPGRNAEAVADLALAFMLMLARKMVDANAFLRQPGEAGDMGRQGRAHSELQGRELWNKTIGLVGLGAVGRTVARRVRAFGARVIVSDPFITSDDAALLDAELVTLDELLARSDFVSLHAPVTDATRGLIGAAQIARMKPGACLINTARAALMDEDALVSALRSGRLAGAATDVFSVEPPASDHPLLTLPNVIATPHVGGNTIEVGAHQGHIVAEDLRQLIAGQTPRCVLNPETLAPFSWHAPRPSLDAAALAALAARPAPAVSDLQREPTPQTEIASSQNPLLAMTRETAPERNSLMETTSPKSQMEKILRLFIQRAVADPTLGAFAAKGKVATHYTLTDLDLEFYIAFRGQVTGDLGAPPQPAEVKMKAKAETLDAILTGKLSGNKAAMSGKLSFSGDVRLAMGMQKVQNDLVRLYSAARAEAGGIDFAAPVPPTPRAPATTIARPMVTEPKGWREELVRVADELFAAGLITATGGNVSIRVPGANEAWITPSQLFKGGLRTEMMVRVDFEGNALDADALAPSSERQVHCEIYKARPDVEAIIHAHAPYATILVLSGLPFLPVTTEAAFIKEIPRVPFIMPGSKQLAVEVTQALGKGIAVLMQNHGLVVAASSLRHAANTVEVIERVAQLIWGCYAVGKKPPTLPKDVVATLREIGEMMA